MEVEAGDARTVDDISLLLSMRYRRFGEALKKMRDLAPDELC